MSGPPGRRAGHSANRIPGRYRGVAVARYGGSRDEDRDWDEASLRAHFLGREAYWKTRFLVVRPHDDRDGRVALLAVARDPGEALFSPITAVELLAGPGECVLVHRPEVDTAIPSALTAVAAEVVADTPDARAVIVQGRYEHINFVVDPEPLRVVVREVVPPHPAKLVDQARRIVDVTEDLRPLSLRSEVVDLADLAGRRPADHYLLPCRGGGGEIPGARVSYLDERPEPADWTLLGCERSRQIHRWFYGRDAPGIDLCPKVDPAGAGPGALLTKCCLQQEELDEGVATGPDGETAWVSVPWGASLEHVREALRRLVEIAERGAPPWSPA